MKSEESIKKVREQALIPLTGLRRSVVRMTDTIPEVVRIVGIQQKKLDAMHQVIEQVTNATIEVGQVRFVK